MEEGIYKHNEGLSAFTTQRIAYILITLYGVALISIGIGAYLNKDPDWLDLFKSGFLILGGGLSTVIGYYFGSRGTQMAEAGAEQVKKEAASSVAEIREILSNLEDELPTTDENTLISPDEYSSMEEE